MMTILATLAMTYTVMLPIIVNPPSSFWAVYDEGNHRSLYAPWSRIIIPASWSTGVPPHLAKTAAQWWTMACLRGPVPEDKRLYSNVDCSPPDEQYYQEYADFTLEIAATGVKAIELGNEPNLAYSNIPFVGCWGTDYAAGRRYGDLARVVYDTVKPVYPDVQIVIGAMNDRRNDFVAGMFASAAGHYDAASYHAYVFADEPSEVTAEFADYLRLHTDKPLILSETAILSTDDCAEAYQLRQVEHWHYLAGLDALDWFAWYEIGGNGWPEVCPTSMYPNPVYYEYLMSGSVP